jgi:DNA repair protein RecN (Recombination protein N)
MLKQLTIKNYALIRQLVLEPSARLNVITGETGAGKSIMLGALGLLMGNRADTKVLWNEDEKCVIEGSYDIAEYKLKSFFKSQDLDYDSTTVIRREISPGGKSRAFINDTPVTLDVMRKLGGLLMDIHSQHETLELGDQTFQLLLIDAFAQNQSLKDEYTEAWSAFQKAKKAFDTLTSEAETLRNESDYIRFQLDELTKAELVDGEQDKLESELKVMEHAEEIKIRLNNVLNGITRTDNNALSLLTSSVRDLQQITGFSSAYEALLKRVESVRIELEDIAAEAENEENVVEFDPERAESIKERLSNIYRLLKKHKASDIKELIALQESLQQKANLTANLDEAMKEAKQNLDITQASAHKLAQALSTSRKKTFDPLCKQIIKLLRELGIPDASLSVQHGLSEISATGTDLVDILFSANKGITPRPLASVASGGEFSRLMFCIKYVMAEKKAMPTLILDEIDNGVSGEIAMKLGNLMMEMSKNHQVIAISHLPQIAAKGDEHYFVYKDSSEKKTVSNVRKLDEDERVEEIAKMIGGERPSKVALQNAQELLSR